MSKRIEQKSSKNPSGSDSQLAIFMDHVRVQYYGRTVLEDIQLRVREREIVSIVGPNGAGKTTLLNTILGFLTPQSGLVLVLGRNPISIQKAGLIGYLPQISNSNREFPVSVFDVVAMSRQARKRLGSHLTRDDHHRIDQVLSMVGMSDHTKHHFGSLSSGQQQRVLIARALAVNPRILLLDEPSTGLDAVAQNAFYRMLTKIRDDEGITIVLVSHDIGTVSSVVDQIACLNKKIHFHGKPADCIPSAAIEEVFGKNIHFLLHDDHCDTCRKNDD